MTIQNTDIKLLAPEQLNDSTTGGGSATATVVVDGEVNNLFNDISRTDRTHGRLSLRKTFLSVQSALTEAFLGAHAIVSQRAADDAVRVAMFSTGSLTDTRSAAQGRLENYIVKGGRTAYELYGNHLAGTRRLLLHTAHGVALPVPDQVLVLRNAAGTKEQFVRLSRVEPPVIRAFTLAGGTPRVITRQMISCDLQAPLVEDFLADEVTDVYVSNPATAVLDTMPGAGAQYFGCMDLAGTATAGAGQISVTDPYAQIVPTADVETPFMDLTPWIPGLPMRTHVYEVTTGTRRYNWTHQVANALQAGHMTVDYMVFGKWVRLTDNGQGQFTGRPGAGSGTLNYDSGSLVATLGALPDVGSKIIFTWRVNDTNAVGEKAADLSTTFPINTTLNAPIIPGSVRVLMFYTVLLETMERPGGVWIAQNYASIWAPITANIAPTVHLTCITLTDNGSGDLLNGGEVIGSINYSTGALQVNDFDQTPVKVRAFYQTAIAATQTVAFRLEGAPLVSQSVQIKLPTFYGNVVLNSTALGALTGVGASGTIDYQTGFCTLTCSTGGFFTAEPILMSGVSVKRVPLDKNLIGVDPVRMPSDGRVPIVSAGQMVVIHHTAALELPLGLTSGQVCAMGRTNLAWIEVHDATGARIPEDRFTVNTASGNLTWANPINLAGFVEPLTARHRIEEMRLVTDVQFTGEITLARPLLRDFAAGTQVSSVLEFGDLQARQSALFRQSAWTGVWQDTVIGSTPAASYNDVAHPLALSNTGAIPQRWALVFTSAAAFNVLSEDYGQIATGNTSSPVAPINPATGTPYFTLDPAGWSAGWAAGNVLRFNTEGILAPFWLIRTTQIDPDGFGDDDFRVELRGDIQ